MNTTLQNRAMENAVKLLDSVGASYKITLEDGSVISGGKHVKRSSQYPHGALKKHFEPYVKDMDVGDVAAIPAGEFGIESIRSSLCGWTNRIWGKGASTSTVNHETKTVEILRLS